ncbi:helix-turn-helix domain-containing protein [Streptomyces sp. MAR25Y5]|uniref:helix-turn-helix domain-containing protein n=1 Tax=Streptomyces sp. MAR25Y5 TaxID=2962028 RepID=UPI0020B767B8|nr:helix-turn-helix transcriptional regulator [Streptomyces sp. MAR25Y5]MCP3765391.1 helix-turn-helix transcriptional regulator [Streptomyces sp. MAR25Y5]
MPPRRQPTARQARLGAELRKLREAAGLKATEAASLLGVNSVQMSQIESGIAGVSEERLRRLVAHYACDDEALIAALVVMATERKRGWWEEYRGLLPNPFLDLAELEHHAGFRWDVDFLHIPGLLQTEDYARALFSYMNVDLAKAEVDRWVEHRMRRRVILEKPEPTPYSTVVHEAALRVKVGDRAQAVAQLLQVLELSEAEHVTVRVIPFDVEGFGGAGSAMIYAGGATPVLDTVVRDGPHGTAFVDAEAQLQRFRKLFRKMEAVALEPECSRAFIHRLTKEL